MPTTSLTGSDIIKLNGRILKDFADADVAMITFPNELMQVKTGKNGNSIYAFNYAGRQCDLKLRLLRGSTDDKFIQGLFASMMNNPASFSLVTGEFTKIVGDGASNLTNDVYLLSGGAFKKQPEVKENADGDTSQAVVEWELRFSNAPRSIG